MFISTAFAQAPGGGGGGGFLIQIFPLILLFAVFYFLLIRPQNKRAREHREMVAAIRRGDTVVTGGGLIGRVVRVGDDNEIQVEIAEGVRVKVVKTTVTEVRGKGQPAQGEAAPPAKSEGGEDDQGKA